MKENLVQMAERFNNIFDKVREGFPEESCFGLLNASDCIFDNMKYQCDTGVCVKDDVCPYRELDTKFECYQPMRCKK